MPPQEEYIEEGGEVTRAKDVTGVTSLKDGGDPVSTPHPVAGVEVGTWVASSSTAPPQEEENMTYNGAVLAELGRVEWGHIQ